MRVGWTPNWLASSLTVRSPLRAARATWFLNAAVCCLRLPAMVPPFLGHQSSLAGGPVFGVHYSMRKLLARLGCCFHKASAFLFKADQDKQKEFIADYGHD